MRRLVAALALAVAGCSSGTFALVTIAPSGTTPPGIKSLQLSLELDGKMASATLSEKGGADVALPTTASLQLRSGAGPLSITVVARDANGAELGRGSGSGLIVAGHRANIGVTLAFGGAGASDLGGADASDGGGAVAGGGGGADASDAAGPDLAQTAMLAVSPSPQYDFGSVVVGGTAGPASFTIVNHGGAASGALGMATLGGSDASAFAIQSDGCAGKMLAPDASCAITVVMTPTAASALQASLSVAASPGGTAAITLTGTALTPGALQLAPATQGFDAELISSGTSTRTLMLTNTGASPTSSITLSVTGSDMSQFAISGGTCLSLGTLTGGASCSVVVQFKPTVAGARSASLQASASVGGTAVASLSGVGLTAANLAFSQASYTGPTVTASSTGTVTLTVNNLGTQDSGPLGAPGLSGDPSLTLTSGGTCAMGSPVRGGTSCTLVVKFAPTTYGTRTGTVSVSAAPGGSPSATISATGQQTFTLTVSASGSSGSGTIASVGTTDVDCGGGASTCSHSYTVTTSVPTVMLTATAASGSRFAAFGGDCTGTTCSVSMSANHFVSANFVLQHTLSVTVGGTGVGTVTSTSSPTQSNQIRCASGTCSVVFDTGTQVTLSEVPGTSSFFSGWASACSGANGCIVTLDADKTVGATFTLSTGHLAVAVSNLDGVAGSVTSSAGGINCPGTCSASGLSGTVTLTATPNAATTGFVAWGGDCAPRGASNTCSLNLSSGDHTNITATFSPFNVIFPSSTKVDGTAIGSVTAADKICTTAAANAGLPGASQYVAFITSQTGPAATVAIGSARGWKTIDGNPFADTLSSALGPNGVVWYAPTKTETGVTVGSNDLFWTGSSDAYGDYSTGPSSDCDGWVADGVDGIAGIAFAGTGNWMGGSSVPCNWSSTGYAGHVLCMGTKYQAPVTQKYTAGRRVFVTQNQYTPGTAFDPTSSPKTFASVSDAAAACRTEAAAHGLCADSTAAGCPFKALLSTMSASALSLLTNDSGGSWYRLDGVPVGGPSDFAGELLPQPITVNSALGYDGGHFVWTGSNAPNGVGTTGSTCNDWTSSTNLYTGYVGWPISGARWWQSGTASPFCNTAAAFYCIEDISG